MLKVKRLVLLVICMIFLVVPFTNVYATGSKPEETLSNYINNLVGPSKLYDTELSPIFVRSNYSEEYVNPRSGNLTLTQTDYYLPGKNGLDFELKRIYRSGTSNIQDMTVEYVNGAWVDKIKFDTDTPSFFENRYNLGIGMRFSFPTIEVKQQSNNKSHFFFHSEGGDVYTLKPVLRNGKTIYKPEGQSVDDIYLKESTEFTNSTDGSSKYVLTNNQGKKFYFTDDGRIMGIVDRYNNVMIFDYSNLTYKINGTQISKRLVSKITDTVGREIRFEYTDDPLYKVRPKGNESYNIDDSYNAYQGPNNVDSGDLSGKFKVIVTLPDNKQIVYNKSAALVSDTKNVVRTRLQSVIDTDNKPKYHFWYEQPELGFTFTDKDNYSAHNRYENLVQVDYLKSNRIKRYIYRTYKKKLNQGSMEYRKVYRTQELIKNGFEYNSQNFFDSFNTEVKDSTIYTYKNEPDGYGHNDFKNDYYYLRDTYQYYTNVASKNGSTVKYTYDGLHELVNTEKEGQDHKSTTSTEYDSNKLVTKREKLIYNKKNGVIVGEPVEKIENYQYDKRGNLLNYTGPIAERDVDGLPIDIINTVTYSYDYNKYDVLLLKTWYQDKNTQRQIKYTADNSGNITKKIEKNDSTSNNDIVTEYRYDTIGNLTKKIVKSPKGDKVTNFEYGTDMYGVNHKGAYLTKEYTIVDGVKHEKRFAYNHNTGSLLANQDAKGNVTKYKYDSQERLVEKTHPDLSKRAYEYIDSKNSNRAIITTNEEGTKYKSEYDILGYGVKDSVYTNNSWLLLSKNTYDSKGNKTSQSDSKGNGIKYEYDSAYRIIRKYYVSKDNVNYAREGITLDYSIINEDDTKLLLEVTDADGYSKKYHYDIQNRLVKYSKTLDKQNYFDSTYTYDLDGNRRSSTDYKGNTYLYTFDRLGRSKSIKNPYGSTTSITYDERGNIIEKHEPGNKIIENVYDNKDRIKETKIYKKSDTDYIYYQYEYDKNDNILVNRVGDVKSGTNTLRSQTSYVYDNMDRIIDKYIRVDEDRQAHIVYKYDSMGNQIQQITNLTEDEASYIKEDSLYDFDGRLIDKQIVLIVKDDDGSTNERGRTHVKYTFDIDGNLMSKNTLNNNSFINTSYTYDFRKRLINKTESLDTNKNKITQYNYDNRGLLQSETISNNGTSYTTSYTYDGDGNMTLKRDPMGYTSRYLYDGKGNLIKEIDPRYSNQSIESAPGTIYHYDKLDRVIKTEIKDNDESKVIAFYEYDSRGNMIKQGNGEGYNSTSPKQSIGDYYEYDIMDRQTIYISAQTVKDNGYDGVFTMRYEYDANGNVLKEEDSEGNITEYSYYMNNKMKQKKFPDNRAVQMVHDLLGAYYVATTDRANRKTKTYKNLMGKPYKIIYPDGTEETFEYNNLGNMTKYTDKIGNPKFFVYDNRGLLLQSRELVKEENGFKHYKISKYTYDVLGNMLSSETFEGKKSTSNANIVETSLGDRVTYKYNGNSLLTDILGPIDKHIIMIYDKGGNLITQKTKIQDNDYEIIKYTYDTLNRVLEVSNLLDVEDVDTSIVASAEFDEQYITKIKSSTKYSYYSNSKVKTMIDANNNTTNYEYNLDGRLTKKTDALGNTLGYKYDLRGNVIEEKNHNNITKLYDYDSMGRLIRVKTPIRKGEHVTTRYQHDVMGNITKTILPNQYDANKDDPETISELKGMSYEYDNMDRRIITRNPEGSIIEKIEYTPMGSVRKVTDGLRLASGQGISYQYDGLQRVTSITDVYNNTKSFKYDVLGNITEEINQKGHTTRYEYNPDSTVSRVSYADGAQVLYVYDSKGRVICEVEPKGSTTSLKYNKLGKIKEKTDALGNTSQIKYDLVGNPVILMDAKNNKSLIKYDKLNRVVEKKTPIQNVTSVKYAIEKYEYDNLGRIGKQTTTGTVDTSDKKENYFTYYDDNKVESVTYNSGAYTKYFYDDNGNVIKKMTSREDDNYNIEKYLYDTSNRLVESIKLIDRTSLSDQNLSSLADEEYIDKIKMTTAFEYDILGNKIKEIKPKAFLYALGDARRKEYTTAYQYDRANRPKRVVITYQGTESYIEYYYDEIGNRIKERNPKGYITTIRYDELGRISSITDSKDSTLTYDYDIAGNKIKESNSLGNSISYEYDELSRLIRTIDPYNNIVTRNEYDELGRVVAVYDAKGNKRTYDYSPAGQLIAMTDGEGNQTIYTYNQYGQQISITNGEDETTSYKYDNAGRLTKVVDGLGVTTTYAYNKVNNKILMKDGRGKITRYQYGDFGMLLKVINPEDKTIEYTYDIHGNIASMKDKNEKTTLYEYNTMDMLVSKSIEGTDQEITYDYDVMGNRTIMEDESGISEYTYDELNHLIEITKDSEREISYTYDIIGNIETVEDRAGNTTSYTYDKANRMKTVTSNSDTTTYNYDANGNRESIEYDGGVKEEYIYNRNNRVTSVVNKTRGNKEISRYDYTYDKAGRQSSKTDSFGRTDYAYDEAGRIKKVKAPGYTTTYEYDKSGNRTGSIEVYTSEQPTRYVLKSSGEEVKYNKKTTNYTYTSANLLLTNVEKMYDTDNREVLRKTTKYLYDDNGNQLSQYTSFEHPHTIALRQSTTGNLVDEDATAIDTRIERTRNYFDGFNRLKKVERIASGDRHVVEFTYNGDGLRTKKESSKLTELYQVKTTNYHYDRQHVILETDESGNKVVSYIRGINYIAKRSNASTSYYLYNGHGDVVQTVRDNGTVVNQYEYDVFGKPRLTIEQESNSIRYAGEFYDEETGLYYLRARYYNPYIGRFISEDSYWGEDTNPLSLNLYTYCENDPIRYVDPSGHVAIIGSKYATGSVSSRKPEHKNHKPKSSSGSRRPPKKSTTKSEPTYKEDLEKKSSNLSEILAGMKSDKLQDSNDYKNILDQKNKYDAQISALEKANAHKPSSVTIKDRDGNSTTYDYDTNEVITNNEEVVEKINEILQLDDNLQYDPRVEQMQIRLNELGFRDKNGNPLATDGKFGPKTEEALNNFKETNGLWNHAQYKGKAGKTTLDFMYSDNAKSYKQVQSEIVNSGKIAFKENQEVGLDTIDYNDVSTQGVSKGYLNNAEQKDSQLNNDIVNKDSESEESINPLTSSSKILGFSKDDFPTQEELDKMSEAEILKRITGIKAGYYLQFFGGGSEDIAFVKNTDGDWAILYSVTGFAGTAIEANAYVGFFETSSTTDITALYGNTVVAGGGGGAIVTVNYEHGFISNKDGYIHVDGINLGLGGGGAITGGLSNSQYLISNIDGETKYNKELIYDLIMRH